MTSLKEDQFKLSPVKYWESEATKIDYPLEWEIEIAELDISIRIIPKINKQEFNSTITYWEGAIDILSENNSLLGEGYMELTGYN